MWNEIPASSDGLTEVTNVDVRVEWGDVGMDRYYRTLVDIAVKTSRTGVFTHTYLFTPHTHN